MSNGQSVTVISAEPREQTRQLLRDLWAYRELFLTFLQRDLKVRYKQTALGVVWVILQPLIATGAYALIFGKIARMPTDGLPYILFYFAATVPWNAFTREISGCAQSLESNAHLITKVYFPRLIVPAAIICASFVDFAIGWVLLNVAALWMGAWHWQLPALTPVLLLTQWLTSLGAGLFLAALNAQYRDVKYTVGFLLQVWMLASPVIYPLSGLPAWAQQLAFLNPMAAVIETYRACFRGSGIPTVLLLQSLAMGGIYFTLGLWFFRKRETRLIDIL